MYKVIDNNKNVYEILSFTEYDKPVKLIVDYDPGDVGEKEVFSTSGMIGRVSWGSPSYPSQIEIIEAFILDKDYKPIMEIALNHNLIKINDDMILEYIENYIETQKKDRW